MKRVAIIILLSMVFTVNVSSAETLTIYTEEFPPYNFTENGKITGVSTDVVEKVMAKAGFTVKLKSLPWARSYNLVQKEKNALIYSISRRANREKLFKWVGILTPTTYSVFGQASRDDIKVQQLNDMKNYRIGTSIDDARESYLVEKGFALTDFDRMGGDNAHVLNLKKLINKRIDLWPMPDAVAYYITKKEGHKPERGDQEGISVG